MAERKPRAKPTKNKAAAAAALVPPVTDSLETTSAKPPATNITTSRGLAAWLRSQRCAIAFTSYQTGKLFLIGSLPDGRISFHQQSYQRAMGVHAQSQRLYVASLFQIWRLENVLAPSERANKVFDRLFVPRNAQIVGDLDTHEIGVDRAGRLIFVNTKFSCLCTTSTRFGFRPIWKPPFISRLAAEDRCHLNGLGIADGVVRYATAVSRSDIITGWRDRRHEGGVLIDVQDSRIVTDELSMPHSPRLHGGRTYVLDSGRGMLLEVDARSGKRREIAFCPGFLRGLAFHSEFALATVSLPRDGSFSGLELDESIRKRDGEPWCGVLVISLASGDIVEYLRFDGEIRELFDVAVIPDATLPMAIGLNAPEIHSMTSFDAEFGQLNPTPQ
jgi:uncharacterized protein (TIGR03032 family)